MPDHREGAVLQHRDLRVGLLARGHAVDAELLAGRAAVAREDPREDAVAAAVIRRLVLPDHDEAAVGEGRHVGPGLRARDRHVRRDLDGFGHRAGDPVHRRIDPRPDAPARAVALPCRRRRRGPGDHRAAIGESRDPRQVLVAVGILAHPLLGRDCGAVIGEARHVGAVAAAVLVAARPGHREAAGDLRDRRVQLVVRGLGIHREGRARGQPVGAVDLRLHRAGRAVRRRVVVAPGDDEAAIVEPGRHRIVLAGPGQGVDQELAADLGARRVVALRIDAEGAVGRVLRDRAPGHHRPAAGERGDMRLVLLSGGEGVDPLFRPGGLQAAVGCGRHRDREGQRPGGAARPVIEDQLGQPLPGRIVRAVGIADRLDQRLDRGPVRPGPQRDAEVCAVLAVAEDRADRRGAEEHLGPGDRDAAAREDREAVLPPVILRAESLQVADRLNHRNDQHAAVEHGAVGIGQIERAEQRLRSGIDLFLAEGRVRHACNQRICGQARAGRVAEHPEPGGVVGAVAGRVGTALLAPADREGVIAERHDVPKVLLAAGAVMGAELVRGGAAIGGIGL